MNECDMIEDAVLEGQSLDDAQQTHITKCAQCNEFTTADRALSQLVANASEDTQLPESLRAMVASNVTPVASFSLWQRSAVPLILVAVVVCAGMLVRPRSDLSAQQGMTFVAVLMVFATLVVAGIYIVLHRGSRGLGASRIQRLIALVAVLGMSELVMALVSHGSAASTGVQIHELLLACAHCGVCGTLVSLVVALGFFGVARRTAVTSPSLMGAVAGATSGLSGAMYLHVTCPNAAIDHMMISHGGPVVLGAVIGALVGKRLLAP
jgi:hypothetical protein